MATPQPLGSIANAKLFHSAFLNVNIFEACDPEQEISPSLTEIINHFRSLGGETITQKDPFKEIEFEFTIFAKSEKTQLIVDTINLASKMGALPITLKDGNGLTVVFVGHLQMIGFSSGTRTDAGTRTIKAKGTVQTETHLL